VSLGAAIDAALPFLQSQATSMQTQQLRIVRNGPLESGNVDPVTGVVTPAQTVIYTGPGRVKPQKRITGGAGGTDVGELKSSESVFVVSVPHTAVGIRPGDIVKVTASKDPELLLDTFRVGIIEDSEQTTARRLVCELLEDRQL
jgi:hypothetical protein